MFLAVEADFMLVNPLPINRLLLYASLKLGLENRDFFFFFFFLGSFYFKLLAIVSSRSRVILLGSKTPFVLSNGAPHTLIEETFLTCR